MSVNTFDFERYLNIRSAYAPIWLENGQRVAFLTDITGTPQVWSIGITGGWPEQLSFFQDKVWGVNASPAGDQMICTRDIGGNERYQLFLISADGVEVRRLSQDDQAIYHFGGWSPDGKRFAYASNSRNGVHFDAYVQDTAGGTPKMVFRGDGNYRVLTWSPDNRRLLLSLEVSSSQQLLTVVDIASGSTRLLTPVDKPSINRQVYWPAGETLFLVTNRDRDLLSLARMDARSGEITYLLDSPWESESMTLSPDGKGVAFTVNRDGYAHLELWRLSSDKPIKVMDLPNGVVAGPRFSPDGKYVAVSVQTPTHPLDIWTVEVSNQKCQQLTHSSLAGIPQETLVKPELIQYETFDGRKIPAFFYRPREREAPLPVILYVHGGPASQTRPDFDPRFQFFLNRGYGILAPNVRGSSGYGKTYMALDDIHLRMDSVADLKYAVEWLHQSGEVDPNRIAIYGRSYGGFMVLAAVTSYPELWAAAINVVGIGNWVTFLENTSAWRRAHREQEYGSLEHDRDFLEKISPIYKVDQIQAPMLVIHGANDPRVPVTEADQIVSNLQQREHPVEYLCYHDEGHKISKLHNRIESFTKMAAFLERYL